MTPDQLERLKSWLTANAPLVTPRRSQTEHLDRLFGVPATADLVTLGLEAHAAAVSILGDKTERLMVTLVIPLRDVEAIAPVAPTSDGILRELSDEPPSLALVHPDALKILERVEEYRAPAHLPRFGPLPGSYCFYRVFRNEEAMRRGWEFGRCLVIYHAHE